MNKDEVYKRIFIGVPLMQDLSFQRDFNTLKGLLVNKRVSWVKKENRHVTLRFLGSIAQKQIDEMIQIINQMDLSIGLNLKSSGLDVFRSIKHAKVIFVKVEELSLWMELYSRLNRTLADLNLATEENDFQPHITLGRIRKSIDKELIKRVIGHFENRFVLVQNRLELCVYESILQKTGAVYKVLFRKTIN